MAKPGNERPLVPLSKLGSADTTGNDTASGKGEDEACALFILQENALLKQPSVKLAKDSLNLPNVKLDGNQVEVDGGKHPIPGQKTDSNLGSAALDAKSGTASLPDAQTLLANLSLNAGSLCETADQSSKKDLGAPPNPSDLLQQSSLTGQGSFVETPITTSPKLVHFGTLVDTPLAPTPPTTAVDASSLLSPSDQQLLTGLTPQSLPPNNLGRPSIIDTAQNANYSVGGLNQELVDDGLVDPNMSVRQSAKQVLMTASFTLASDQTGTKVPGLSPDVPGLLQKLALVTGDTNQPAASPPGIIAPQAAHTNPIESTYDTAALLYPSGGPGGLLNPGSLGDSGTANTPPAFVQPGAKSPSLSSDVPMLLQKLAVAAGGTELASAGGSAGGEATGGAGDIVQTGVQPGAQTKGKTSSSDIEALLSPSDQNLIVGPQAPAQMPVAPIDLIGDAKTNTQPGGAGTVDLASNIPPPAPRASIVPLAPGADLVQPSGPTTGQAIGQPTGQSLVQPAGQIDAARTGTAGGSGSPFGSNPQINGLGSPDTSLAAFGLVATDGKVLQATQQTAMTADSNSSYAYAPSTAQQISKGTANSQPISLLLDKLAQNTGDGAQAAQVDQSVFPLGPQSKSSPGSYDTVASLTPSDRGLIISTQPAPMTLSTPVDLVTYASSTTPAGAAIELPPAINSQSLAPGQTYPHTQLPSSDSQIAETGYSASGLASNVIQNSTGYSAIALDSNAASAGTSNSPNILSVADASAAKTNALDPSALHPTITTASYVAQINMAANSNNQQAFGAVGPGTSTSDTAPLMSAQSQLAPKSIGILARQSNDSLSSTTLPDAAGAGTAAAMSLQLLLSENQAKVQTATSSATGASSLSAHSPVSANSTILPPGTVLPNSTISPNSAALTSASETEVALNAHQVATNSLALGPTTNATSLTTGESKTHAPSAIKSTSSAAISQSESTNAPEPLASGKLIVAPTSNVEGVPAVSGGKVIAGSAETTSGVVNTEIAGKIIPPVTGLGPLTIGDNKNNSLIPPATLIDGKTNSLIPQTIINDRLPPALTATSSDIKTGATVSPNTPTKQTEFIDDTGTKKAGEKIITPIPGLTTTTVIVNAGLIAGPAKTDDKGEPLSTQKEILPQAQTIISVGQGFVSAAPSQTNDPHTTTASTTTTSVTSTTSASGVIIAQDPSTGAAATAQQLVSQLPNLTIVDEHAHTNTNATATNATAHGVILTGSKKPHGDIDDLSGDSVSAGSKAGSGNESRQGIEAVEATPHNETPLDQLISARPDKTMTTIKADDLGQANQTKDQTNGQNGQNGQNPQDGQNGRNERNAQNEPNDQEKPTPRTDDDFVDNQDGTDNSAGKAAAVKQATEQQDLSEEKELKNFIREFEERRVYRVRKGDTMASIALHNLGSTKYLPLLIELNRDSIIIEPDGKITLVPNTLLTLPSQADLMRFVSSGDASAALFLASQEEDSEDFQAKYACRLGDNLKTIAARHPAMKDARLWPLLAKLNNLSTKQTDKKLPIEKLKRGQILIVPSYRQKVEFLQELHEMQFR